MKLRGQDLQIIPTGQARARDAHGTARSVVAVLAQAIPRQVLDGCDVRLLLGGVGIRVQSLIGIPLEGLRMALRPTFDFGFVNPYLVVFDPGFELRQGLGVVVCAHTRIPAVIPRVQAADQVVPLHETIGHERAAVQSAPI